VGVISVLRRRQRRLIALGLAIGFSLWLLLWPAAAAPRLRKVPGPSPAQTIERFLVLTARAEASIRAAIRDGMAEPGWLYSSAVNRRVAGAINDLEQATQALDLSQVPPALRQMSGVATMLMLRSVLLYELSQEPAQVLPDQAEVQRNHVRTWTLPDTTISLAAIGDDRNHSSSGCRRCTSGDFLFTPNTLAQVPEDFEQIFRFSPALRHRFGADLFVYWALAPGGAVPPKLFFRLPLAVRHQLLQPFAGQSLLQWLLLIPSSLLMLLGMLCLLWWLREQQRRYGGLEGPLLSGLAVVVIGLEWLLVVGWQWFAITWINLIGPAESTVLVLSRILQGVLQMLLLYLLAETIGQVLVLRGQSLRVALTSGFGAPQHLPRRQGAGQILTLSRVVGLVAAVMASISMGRDLGVTSMTLLALSSVPALAISLGTQQLIRDIADGFSLLFDGQIKIGDTCTIGTGKSGEIKGVIRSLGMRSMRIQQEDGSILALPNSQVADAVVVNHRFRSGRRLTWSVRLQALDPPALAGHLAALRAELKAVPQLREASVELAPVVQGWELQVSGQWDQTLSGKDVSGLREALLLRVLPLVRRLEGSEPSS
jgi:MscS family membrane protein